MIDGTHRFGLKKFNGPFRGIVHSFRELYLCIYILEDNLFQWPVWPKPQQFMYHEDYFDLSAADG